MENPEEIFHFLEEFSKRKPKIIPQELNDYLAYVARTGDPVFKWPLVKCLFKEKLLNVITDFYGTSPGVDIPPYPNVDPFNYEVMKNSLLERLDSFRAAPFTIQRISELLMYPRKQYNRVDKYMRAIEKNILVVSTREPSLQRHVEAENGDLLEPIVNGSDYSSEYNVVDVEMEDGPLTNETECNQNQEPQPGSSDTQISAESIEAHLKTKAENSMDVQEKNDAQYESVTPPELNITENIKDDAVDLNTEVVDNKLKDLLASETSTSEQLNIKNDTIEIPDLTTNTEIKSNSQSNDLLLSEIKVDVEIPEQKLDQDKTQTETSLPLEETHVVEKDCIPTTTNIEPSSDNSNLEPVIKEDISETKLISEGSTSSEESSSSSDNADGNSNSPKTDLDSHVDILVEPKPSNSDIVKSVETESHTIEDSCTPNSETEKSEQPVIQTDNYSIGDVNSELPQITSNTQEEQKELIPAAEEMTESKAADEEPNN